MEIKYQNNELYIQYQYQIRPHTHSTNKMGGTEGITTTQYLMPLSTTLKEMTNIRQVLFIYNHNNTTHLTPQEPPQNTEYHTIKTYVNKQHKQTTIQLPEHLLPQLDKNKKQNVTIKYYPQKQDPYNPEQPLITLHIHDRPTPPKQTIAKLTDKNTLTWKIQEEIPEDLKPFLTEQQIQQIQPNTTIQLDLQTLQTTITPEQ